MCLTGQDTFARLITRIISSCYGSSTNFLPKGKSFFPSTKYASLPKSQFFVETFTCPYFQQTLSILQTFCEPILGFQCVLYSTDGDSIADRVSLYRAHNPLFVTTAPAGAPSPIYFLSLTLLLASPPPSPFMFSIHFPLSSPWLLLFESHPNCSVWELDLFSLLSQPPLSMSCPHCTGSSLYSPLPPAPNLLLSFRPVSCLHNPWTAGGQNHDSIVWSRFRRD